MVKTIFIFTYVALIFFVGCRDTIAYTYSSPDEKVIALLEEDEESIGVDYSRMSYEERMRFIAENYPWESVV